MFILVDVTVNVDVSELPRPCMAVMAATAIRAAIRPYSIAVAPFLAAANLRKNFMLISKS